MIVWICTRNRTLTIEESHFRFDGGGLHQRTHHHRQVLLELLPQDLTHARPCRDHVGDLEAQEGLNNTIRETLVSGSMICLVFADLWVIILKVIEVSLCLQEELHHSWSIRHELQERANKQKGCMDKSHWHISSIQK